MTQPIRRFDNFAVTCQAGALLRRYRREIDKGLS